LMLAVQRSRRQSSGRRSSPVPRRLANPLMAWLRLLKD
jgi:hypothetical protein